MQPEGISRLRLLVDSARLPLIAAARDREVAPLQPGQAVDARVERQTAAGYVVSVRGRAYEFKLPDGASPGDLLKLVYVDDEPRPTFALLRIERAPASGGTALSTAGRLLAALGDPGTAEGSAGAMRASAPLFEGAPPATLKAAALLRTALSLSGLFYESHQAQWVVGTRTTAQLRQEPQGGLPPLPSPASSAQAQVQVLKPSVPEPQAASGDAAPAPTSPANPETEAARPGMPAHPDAFPIIREQLSALESGQIAWRGDAWPGQPMQWEVGDRPDDPDQCEVEAARCWSTRLALSLPRIGDVEARIDLRAAGASLRILADSPQHAKLLAERAVELSAGFAAAGIPLTGLKFEHESAAP